jgi:hypothetical protein
MDNFCAFEGLIMTTTGLECFSAGQHAPVLFLGFGK